MNGNKLSFDEFKEELISKIEAKSVPALKDDDAPEAKDIFLREILDNYFEELTGISDNAPEYYPDNRIQAMLYSKDKDSLFLFISDYFGKNSQFTAEYPSKESLIKRFEITKKTLLHALSGTYANYLELSDPLYDPSKSICENRDQIRIISIYLITDSVTSFTEVESETDSEYGYTLEYHVRDLKYFYNNYKLPYDDSPLEINLEKIGITPVCFPVQFESHNIEYTSYIAVLPGILLAKLYKEYQGLILQGNIRVFLQAKRLINKGIKDTLEGKLGNKSRFFAYNNGISATAENVTLSYGPNGQAYLKAIKNFQIVNGGQTTASIHNVWTLHNYDDRCLDDIFVLMKLTVVSDTKLLKTFVPKIAEYSNTQNAIAKPDFASNDSFYADLEKYSRTTCVPGSQIKWFYERTSGQYGETKRLSGSAKETLKNFESVYPQNRLISKTDIGLYFMAWKQYPYIAATGGSKNFREYNKVLKLPGNGFLPCADSNYYKEMVGLAIIFKVLDKCVKSIFANMDIKGGAKQQVVIYTMSLFSYITRQKLNLIKIWESQGDTEIKLPRALEEYLEKLCNQVYSYFINWNQAGTILTEWTKSESCWILLRSERTEYHIPFPKTLSDYCLTDVDAEKHEKWLKSLYRETSCDTHEITVEPAKPETNANQTSNCDSQSEKDQNVNIPDDLTEFLTKASVMKISETITQLRSNGIIDNELVNLLQKIIAIRKARKRLPEKMIREIAAKFPSVDTVSVSPNNKRNDVAVSGNEVSINRTDDKGPIFEYHSKGAFGKMILGEDGTYILLKGSTISLDDSPQFKNNKVKLWNDRENMLQNSELIRNPDGLTATLQVDVTMDSSGAAAAFVSANTPSGGLSWKYNGITLKKYMEQNK